MSKNVTNAAVAIEALGGTHVVAAIMDIRPNAVANWYLRGLPAYSRDALGPLLEQQGFKFSPTLFKQHVVGRRRRGKA